MANNEPKHEMTRSSHAAKIELRVDLLDLEQVTVSAWKKAKGGRKVFKLSEGSKILLSSGAEHVNVQYGSQGNYMRYQREVDIA